MSKLKYYDGDSWKIVNGQITGDTLPIGSQVPYGSTTPPANWLVCDGSYVSKTTFAELYDVIGDSYLDGGTAPEGTFRLPNKKGRKSVGYDSEDTDFNAIGKKGGSKTHTLTINEMPSHTHQALLRNQGSSSSGFTWVGADANGGYFGGGYIGTTGNGQAHSIEDPYEVDCWIIKAKQSAGLVANVSNTYSESETDTYSCDYVNGTILYDNSTGANDNITLTDNLSNYLRIKVFSKVVFATYTAYFITECETVVGGCICIDQGRLHSETLWLNDTAKYLMNNQSLTKVYEADVRIAPGTSGGSAQFNANTTRTLIYKVVGYKY